MNLENWKIQLRKGLLELVVLNLLCSRRRYGYEMVQLLKTMDGMAIREGNIYPILARLKSDGLVEIRVETSPDGPSRNSYGLTDQGRRHMEEMRQHWERLSVSIEAAIKGELG
ncbi:MAG: helix-turn-helix transcriptional regulator [Pontiellaceae bacterium]|nr:helix-turn-helix transcriptional regulator [Pontiellaceae bacterium]MBN2783890.1 helix-turn-helix transcriptional regulator [Pontiellaceae bacterium]